LPTQSIKVYICVIKLPQDRSAPSTPSRGSELTGSPQGSRARLVSPTLRGEEPASIVIPRPVRLALQISAVSAGSRHTLAVTVDGAVYAWGWGAQGQLGLGHYNSVVFPTKVELTEPIASISAGGIHSCCLDRNGQCYSWVSFYISPIGCISFFTDAHTLSLSCRAPTSTVSWVTAPTRR